MDFSRSFSKGGGRSVERYALDITNVRGHERILKQYGITVEDCHYAYSITHMGCSCYYVNVYGAYKV